MTAVAIQAPVDGRAGKIPVQAFISATASRKHPSKVWAKVVKSLGPETDGRALRGDWLDVSTGENTLWLPAGALVVFHAEQTGWQERQVRCLVQIEPGASGEVSKQDGGSVTSVTVQNAKVLAGSGAEAVLVLRKLLDVTEEKAPSTLKGARVGGTTQTCGYTGKTYVGEPNGICPHCGDQC